MVPVAKPSSPTLLPVGEGRKPPSRRVMWIASFPGAVIDGVSFVDCIFCGVRSTEVVEASGSILFRNVKIEPAERVEFELTAAGTRTLRMGESRGEGLRTSTLDSFVAGFSRP